MDLKRRYIIPEEYSFSFTNFLKQKGMQWLDGNSTTNLFKNKPYECENSIALVAIFQNHVKDIFSLFGIKDFDKPPVVEKAERMDQMEVFEVEETSYTYTHNDMVFKIVLERMFNGHMGYYEDDFTAHFECGIKKFILDCYIFCTNIMSFSTENIDEQTIEKLDHLFIDSMKFKVTA